MRKLLVLLSILLLSFAGYSQELRSPETVIVDSLTKIVAYRGGGKIILVREVPNGGYFYWYGGPQSVDGVDVIAGANGSKWKRAHYKEFPSNLGLSRNATTNPISNTNGTGITLLGATNLLAGLMVASDKAYLDSLRAGLIYDTVEAGSGLLVQEDIVKAATIGDSLTEVKNYFSTALEIQHIDTVIVPPGVITYIEFLIIGREETGGNFEGGGRVYYGKIAVFNDEGTLTQTAIITAHSANIGVVVGSPSINHILDTGGRVIFRVAGEQWRFKSKIVYTPIPNSGS